MDDSPRTRLTLPASAKSISAFSEFVRTGAIAAGIATNEFGKLDLVLEEILINVARYAYTPETGTVEVAYASGGPSKLRVEIVDFGRVFNPLEAEPPDFSRGLAERKVTSLRAGMGSVPGQNRDTNSFAIYQQ